MSTLTRFRALRHASYRRYWLGSMASVGATQLMMVGQGWLVFDLSHSPLMLGVLGAASSIPTILVTLFGGALADRLDKKKIILATSLCNSIFMLCLTTLIFTDLVEVWHIITIAGLVSFVSGIDWPCRQALFPHLIEKEDMLSAVALNSILWQATRMVLPAIGGLLLSLYSPGLVFALCSLGFFSMIPALFSIRLDHNPTNQTSTTLQQIRQGITFVFDEKLFLYLLLLTYASMFFGTSYMNLLPAFADLLEMGAKGYGLLLAATGAGSVTGTLLTSLFQHSRNLGKIILASSFCAGITIYCFCLLTETGVTAPYSKELAAMALLIASAFHSIFVICSMTAMQLRVPEMLRGRVMGLHGLSYSLMPLGSLVFGSLASWYGVSLSVAGAITIYLIILTYITYSKSVLRTLTTQS